MSKMKLQMPKTEAPGNAGLNNAGIETYRNDPMISLTKEEEQNSTDGSRKNEDGKSMRVEIEFHDFELPTSELPDIGSLRTVFEAERNYWGSILQKDLRTLSFFDNGIKLLNNDTVRVLRISDKNTTGLTGIDKESSPWSNLVINVGVSDKPSSAGGSFGIGKNAAFACSQLRLVFYSTMNVDDECATQGVLKLPSYKNGDIKYDGTGFFASLNCEGINPIRECISLDPNYKRTEYGLDKYIVGFEEKMSSQELKNTVIKSSIANFLVAFFTDSLEVRYNDIVVNRDKLPEIFEKYGDEFDPIVIEQYKTLVAPDRVENFSLFNQDDITFYIRLDPEASRKAAVVRSSGMKVFDRGNISGRIGFSAIITLNSENINAYFKSLENPEHNKWAVDRAEKPSEASNNIKKIFGSLKEIIKNMHQEDYDISVDADGLNEFLPFAYIQKAKKNKVEGLSVEVHEKKKKAKRVKKATQVDSERIRYVEDEFGNIDESTIQLVSTDGSAGGIGDGFGHGNGGNGFGGGFGGEGDDEGTNKETFGLNGETKKFSDNEQGEFISKRKIPDDNFSYALEQKDGEYQLRFISKKSVESGFFEINISGEEEAIETDVISASIDSEIAKVSRNKIAFTALSSVDVHTIQFRLKKIGDWALEVSVNEN